MRGIRIESKPLSTRSTEDKDLGIKHALISLKGQLAQWRSGGCATRPIYFVPRSTLFTVSPSAKILRKIPLGWGVLNVSPSAEKELKRATQRRN